MSLAIAATLTFGALVGVAWVAGFTHVLARLTHPHWIWLPLALAGVVVSYIGYLLAYGEVATADGGPELDLAHLGAVVTSGFGVFIPRGGFALDNEALRDLGLTPRDARKRVLGLGILEYAFLAPAAFAAALALLVEGVRTQPGLLHSWVIGVPLGTALTLLALRHRGWFERGGGRRRRIARGLDAIASVARLLSRPQQGGAVAALGMAFYWLGDIFALWACLAAFTAHGSPSIPELILGYATGYALTRRTLPIAGAGAVEALLPFALTWAAIPLAPAVVGVFAYRMLNVWLPMIPAAHGLRTLKRRHARLEARMQIR